MTLTNYYRMAKLPSCKSKLRLDCLTSTGDYEPFEEMAQRGRDNRVKFYFGKTPDVFKQVAKTTSGATFTNGGSITSVYAPDLEHPLFAYGDMIGTNDALLFLFSEDYKGVEVFVARGLKYQVRRLFIQFLKGELANEMERLRHQAKPTNAPRD